MKKQYIVVVTAALAVLAFGLGAYLYNAKQAEGIGRLLHEGNAAFTRPESPSLGPKEAKVELMEFFDPACESCREFYPYVKNMLKASEGKVRLTLRYATLHRGSDYVAQVLEAARMQGQDVYWNTLEAVLGAQPIWADHSNPQPQRVWDFMAGTGLDVARARQDMNDPRIAALLKQDAADRATLNVTRTPSFFINGKPLKDFGIEGLRAQLRSEMRTAYSK